MLSRGDHVVVSVEDFAKSAVNHRFLVQFTDKGTGEVIKRVVLMTGEVVDGGFDVVVWDDA